MRKLLPVLILVVKVSVAPGYSQLRPTGGGLITNNENNVLRCDDRLKFPGPSASARITSCAKSLPPTGGTADARGFGGNQSWNTDAFSGITQPVDFQCAGVTYSVSVNSTIPSNVHSVLGEGCKFSVNSGVTLTVNGPLDGSTLSAHFMGMGSVRINSPNSVYPQWFGAKADGVILGGIGEGTGCTGSAGSASVTCPAAMFTASDVGKAFDLSHAGISNCGMQYWAVTGSTFNCNLVGKINAVNSPTNVTLSVRLSNSVSDEQFAYSSSDDSAFLSSLNSGAPTIFLAGTYGITSGVKAVLANRSITSASPRRGRFLIIGPVAYGTQKWSALTLDNGTHDVTFQDVEWVGTNRLGELNTFGATPDALLICTGIPGGLGGACNSNSGISNIHIINCDFSYTWGIGLHNPGTGRSVGQQVIGIFVYNSRASHNSYDGFNPNPYDQLLINGGEATDNGTGGIEAAVLGKMTVSGGQYLRNKNVGMALGGFGDHASCSDSIEISGNDISENGNNYAPNASGAGIIAGEGACNLTVTGNTIRKNSLMGINYNPDTEDSGFTLVGNTISSNGILGATVSSVGAWLVLRTATVAGNTIRDEGMTGFAQAFGLVVRSGSANAIVANNFVYDNKTRNVQIENGTNVTFIGHNLPTNTADLYIGVTPSASGVTIRIPDVQVVTNACTTPAVASATCTVTVTHAFGHTPNQFSCVLSDTPKAQTGKPIILKYADIDGNQTQVTIATLDGNAAGGGTLQCRTNYAY